MVRTTSVFKLVHVDTTHIIFIGINGVTGFNNLTDNYFRYYYINICV